MMAEHVVEGVLQYVDLGTGAWALALPAGGQLLLEPAPGLSLRGLEGRRVRLRGDAPEAAFSAWMTGAPVMRVRHCSPLVG